MSFKNYVLSGRFNKAASEAVGEAIARTKAHGLPVEGYANTGAPATRTPQRGAGTAQNAKDTKKKPLRRTA